MKKALFFLFLVALAYNPNVFAQQSFNLSGTVVDEKGNPLDLATVFIDGTNKSTYTNIKGEYRFNNLVSGTYQIVANMMGFKSEKINLVIGSKPEVANFKLKTNTFNLKEIAITAKKNKTSWKLELFKKEFLGLTPNGLACEIENPNIIQFKGNNIIRATSKDFIIINNHNLGYRIKYLLRDFKTLHIPKVGEPPTLE